jgi:hypothetical protein
LPKRGNEVLPVREKSGVLTAGKKIVCWDGWGVREEQKFDLWSSDEGKGNMLVLLLNLKLQVTATKHDKGIIKMETALNLSMYV